MQRAWAEVDLDAIAKNLRQIRSITRPEARIMAVVKADAYGHGFLQVAKTLIQNGADALAVAMIDEAKQLRSRGFDVPILILGSTSAALAEDLIDFDVMPTVYDETLPAALSALAVQKKLDAKIHIKLDTGMSRLGFQTDEGHLEETVAAISRISQLPNLVIDGIFTHLACADEDADAYTNMQFSRFMRVCDRLVEAGVAIGTRHVCNSAALVLYPHMQLDMVRPGVILYGMHPSDRTRTRLPLQPAMQLRARITHVKEVEAGVGVSYGSTYITDRPTRIATVPIGYADGYSRLLQGRAFVLWHGKRLPVIGRICMDQCMIDASCANTICVGDVVTVMGCEADDSGGVHSVTADDLASFMGTINYEIVCIIGKRIPRLYLSGGKVVRALNNLV